MSIIKYNYRFSSIPIKIPIDFLYRNKAFLKVVWNYRKPSMCKGSMRKKMHWGASHFLALISTINYSHQNITGIKNRHLDQWSRIESSEINPRIYCQLTFDKRNKNTEWKKISLFHKLSWENWIFDFKWKKKKETRSLSYITHKFKSKWLKNLNVKHEIMKLLEKKKERSSIIWVLTKIF